MNIGDFVRLRGKSRHGRNRLEQFGNHWRVVEINARRVLLGTFFDDKDLRWVDLPEDKDFQIMESWTPTTDMRATYEAQQRDDSGDGPWAVESGTTGDPPVGE